MPEKLNKILLEKHPFLLYRFPKSDLLHYMRIDSTIILDHSYSNLTEDGFIFAPFKASSSYPVCFFKSDKQLAFKFDEPVQITPDVLFTIDSDFKTTSREKYGHKFQQIMDVLKDDNKVRKLVLAKKFFLGIQQFPNAGDILFKLHKAFPNSFLFLVNHPGMGVWCGATPENLLKIDKGLGQTVALAGTQKIEDMHPVNWTGKEKEEQKLVEVFIDKKLSELATEVDKSIPETVFTGNLAHLCTFYKFKVEPQNTIPLLKALHPTPAVCGLPKKESLQILNTIEGFNREYYSGFLGPVSPNGTNVTDVYVSLRCFKMCKQGLEFFMGGGITLQSDEQKEWEETENKLESLLPYIG